MKQFLLPSSIVAHRTAEGIICTDPACEAAYIDVLPTAEELTQAAVEAESENREGHPVLCEFCFTALDTWAASLGARSWRGGRAVAA